MSECDCRSLVPTIILLVFIPLMILIDITDNEKETKATEPSTPVDYITPINDGLEYYKSYGLAGLGLTLLILSAIGYKLYQGRNYTIIGFLILFGIAIIMWFTGGLNNLSLPLTIPIHNGNFTK